MPMSARIVSSGPLIGLTLLAAVIGCGDETAPPEPPVLSVPMVDLTKIREFLPFGAPLPGGRENPAYELVLEDRTLEVHAVTRGTVERIMANDPSQGDSELHVRPARSSEYLVIYDHVLNVRVHTGDVVEPGTVIGRIGNWSPTEGRVELQINRGDLAVCPRDLGTPAFNAAHEAAMAATPTPRNVCLATTVRP